MFFVLRYAIVFACKIVSSYVDNGFYFGYIMGVILQIFRYCSSTVQGEVAERSKAAVLKTVEGIPLPGFESLSLRLRNLLWF